MTNEQGNDMTTGHRVSSYKSSVGLMVEANEGESLDVLYGRKMFDELAEVGFTLFRGFNSSIESFSEFVKSGSSRVTIDPMREFFGDTAQKVDAGYDAIGMHVEHGNNPFQPDLCWFFCERAAESGSQTTVCDGYRVWENMPDDIKTKFADKKIKYCRYIEGNKWKTLTQRLNPSVGDVENVTVDDFRSLVDHEGFRVEATEGDTIYYEYVTSAIHKEPITGRVSFANSILGPSYNYQAPIIKFEDDEPIGADIQQVLEQLFEDATTEVDWQSGDVLVIDNRHIMHGRRAITDENRVIYNAMSFR